jgi:ribonuclease-3
LWGIFVRPSSAERYAALEESLGYSFKNKSILLGARDHPSLSKFLNKFERLEFLGDRVLGLAISEYIFENFKCSEGVMARMYAAFVCAESCHKIALKIGLDRFIRTSDKKLQNNRTVLSDGVEAVLGCVFIDGGYESARMVVLKLWHEIFCAYKSSDQEPKTRLQEMLHELDGSVPIYEVVSVTGSDHDPTFRISVTALGKKVVADGGSKKVAEAKAARMLIDEISKR